MAKRFTDTDKWKKNGFSELDPIMKLAWIYICDNCDHAGIWEVNTKLLSFQLDHSVSKLDLKNKFGSKLDWVTDDLVFIPSFIEFQYGKLNPSNKVHRSVIDRLSKIQGATKELASPFQGAKDKDKEKDMDKDKEKEKDPSEITPGRVIELFNSMLVGVGKMKPSPAYFLPVPILEDYKIITGFPEFQKLKTWENYFTLVSQSEFLTTQFTPSIAWLMKSENAFKVLGGQYQNKDQKNAVPDKREGEAMAMKIYSSVMLAGMHGLKAVLAGMGSVELKALDIFGRASDILNCKSDYDAGLLKIKLTNSCVDAIKLCSTEVAAHNGKFLGDHTFTEKEVVNAR